MNHSRFLLTFCLLAVGIGAFQLFAVSTSLYYEIPSVDTLVHAASGFLVSMAVFSFFLFAQKEALPTKKYFFVATFIAIVCVAIGWEVLEVRLHVFPAHMTHYWSDTLSDVCFGIFGALGGFFILSKKYNLS